MKSLFKNELNSVIFLFIFTSIILTGSFSSVNAQVPGSVRIGLFYEGAAVSGFNVNAEKGIQLGYFKDDKFTALFEEPSGSIINIRKDAFFVNDNNTLKEYNPAVSEDKIPKGEKTGAYHIRIGESFGDLNSTNLQIQDLKQKGINAYPVFVDSWQIWAGFYTGQDSAQNDIAGNIEQKLGSGAYSVVQPSVNRIVCLSGGGDVLLLFDGSAGSFQVHPKMENNPYVFKINGRSYRGDLEIRRYTESDMTVINVLPIEMYLYGVVPSEIESNSHPEALKAQAVAARTYTLCNMGRFAKWGFNLDTTTKTQVYKGLDYETGNTNKAVDDTNGKIVTYNGKAAEVFYFSSSGGRTEDVKNVWGSDVAYLKSVEDKFEAGNSWHYNWEVSLAAGKIKDIMQGRGYDLGDIVSMDITKVSEAGRATELVVKGTKSQRVYARNECRTAFSLDSQLYVISTDADIFVEGKASIPAKRRLGEKKVATADGLKEISSLNANVTILGANDLKKTVPVVPTTYNFKGKGWGHAVGMSQEGAKGMANAGFKYDEIIKYYFQGTNVE